MSPEHIHHHRDKTLALVASMICIGTCRENARQTADKIRAAHVKTPFLAQLLSASSHEDLKDYFCQAISFRVRFLFPMSSLTSLMFGIQKYSNGTWSDRKR